MMIKSIVLLVLSSIAFGALFDPDVDRDFCEVVTAKGYPCEEHYVTTGDGYILQTFRIPATRGPAPPLLLFHGLLDCSFTWIVNFPGQSLSYMLADAGFDVWMGNARGNRYALNHSTLKPSDAAFWAFSWDQQVQYDVPDTVTYIRTVTGAAKIGYVGHSQGTTQGFAAFLSNPQLASQISAYAALAPVVRVGHMSNVLLRFLVDLNPSILLQLLGVHEFMGPSSMPFPINKVIEALCLEVPRVCSTVIELYVGPSQAPSNATREQVIAAHEPGGTSVQNMIHWLQMVRSDLYQMFDYGAIENQKIYGQNTPPIYNLSNYPKTIPTAIYMGSLDELADPIDDAYLLSQLPIKPLVISIPTYSHIDFVWATDANRLIYDSVVAFMQKYSSM
jgi:pimeloyl-ACP methyl ester carboxylesterase